MINNLKIIDISDIHIGNSNIDKDQLLSNFKIFVYPELSNSHLLIINGDFFENLLPLDNTYTYLAIALIEDLLALASKYTFKIRILRGTFTHDRNQNRLFEILANKYKVDLRYIDTISIEHIKDLDLKLLYLPDNLPYKDFNELYEHILDLLNKQQLDKVNILVGHGYFDFNLPTDRINLLTLNYDKLKTIVTGYMLMGHIHTSHKYKDVIYIGSFERFKHDEEEAKGFYKIEYKDDKWYNTFIENTETRKFITLDISKISDLDRIYKLIDITTKKLDFNVRSHLRLILENNEFKTLLQDYVLKKYPNIKLSFKKLSNSTTIENDTLNSFKYQEYIIPNEDNLATLIHNYLLENKSTELSIDNIKTYL